jgi:hypothetical protein
VIGATSDFRRTSRCIDDCCGRHFNNRIGGGPEAPHHAHVGDEPADLTAGSWIGYVEFLRRHDTAVVAEFVYVIEGQVDRWINGNLTVWLLMIWRPSQPRWWSIRSARTASYALLEPASRQKREPERYREHKGQYR